MRGARHIWFLAFLLAATAIASPVLAQGQRIGQVKTATGQAFIMRGSERLPAHVGDPVYESDAIETGASGSTIGVTFIDNTVFSAGPETQIVLSQFRFDSGRSRGEMLAKIRKGSLSVVSGDITHGSPDAMKIETPTTVLGVRGTTFAVKVY